MWKLSKIPDQNDLAIKTLIIYDDSFLEGKAYAMLQRVIHQADAGSRWNIRPWCVQKLKVSPTAEQAMMEAVDVQLIVFAYRQAQGLPGWLLDWLELWAQRRQFQDAALAVTGNENCGLIPELAKQELSEFAKRHGLAFICGGKGAIEKKSEAFALSPENPGLPVPPVPPSSGEVPDYGTYRGWGINE